jgi:hypothetical protein
MMNIEKDTTNEMQADELNTNAIKSNYVNDDVQGTLF